MSHPESPRHPVNRREFLGSSAANAAGVAAGVVGISGAVVAAEDSGILRTAAADDVLIGIVGLRTRGREIAEAVSSLPDARVAAICDVDERQLDEVAKLVAGASGHEPRRHADHRRLLDSGELDAIVIATPDHWHASMAVDACRAGKDVYVEVPLVHTPADGAAVVSAALEHGRIVQAGLQHRSGEHFQSAVDLVRGGGIGRVRMARAWATHERKSIGRHRETSAPEHVDYPTWLGPAPERAFTANRFHHNWRWFWDYGSGELGNWGVHLLDVARWGLGVGLPTRITSTGGKLYFNDEQETPDTQTVNFDYGHATIVWEHRQWSRRGIEGRSAGVAFYGDRGTLVVDRSGWKVYDRKDAPRSDASDCLVPHLRNFVDCIRTRERPVADAGVGHVSTTLCHLGNVAHRVGREIAFDPATGTCPFDDDAQALLT